LHMAQLMPVPLTVSCFSKIQIGFTFLVPAHPGSPGQRAVKRLCVCVCVYWLTRVVLDKELSNGCVSPLGVGLKVCGLVLDSASLGLGLAKMVFLTSLAVCALYYAVESTKATRQNSAVHPTTFRSSSK